MALVDSFHCQITSGDDATLQVLNACCDVTWGLAADQFSCNLTGVYCFGMPVTALRKELTEESFGFRPTHTFVFRCDKFDLHNDGISSALHIVAALLSEVVSDAVLLQNGELPIILRRAGRLTFRAEAWWRKRLEPLAVQLREPYTFEMMPVV